MLWGHSVSVEVVSPRAAFELAGSATRGAPAAEEGKAIRPCHLAALMRSTEA